MAILPTNTSATVTPFISHTGALLTSQGEPTPIELLSEAVLRVSEIALEILSYCDLQTLGRLARVNQFFNACVKTHDEQLNLHHLCPNLRILDAKAQGLTIPNEPRVSNLWILKNYRELESHIENREGLTLLTMPQGRTLNQLVAIAAQAGIDVTLAWPRSEEYRNVPVEQTYVILITNNIFQRSRKKDYAEQQELVAGHRCVMPTVQEYVALCVFTNKVFQKCLYREDPWTLGRTSTQVDDDPLMVGSSTQVRLLAAYSPQFDFGAHGAGGQRRFDH